MSLRSVYERVMEKRWYALQTCVDFEQCVRVTLQQKVCDLGYKETFGEIIISTREMLYV